MFHVKHFAIGFEKSAVAGTTGGSFFGGRGKGTVGRSHANFHNEESGTQEAYGRAEDEDTRTDKTILDRDRTARDFKPFEHGQEFRQEANPHVRY
jgi:hypothetical protein